MPRFKKINRTQAVYSHLKRYRSIDRLTAIQLYGLFDLPSCIRRIKRRALEDGYKIELIEGCNGKYQMYEI